MVPRGSPTVTADLDKDEKWNYYIQTYMMCAPTEGIPLDRTRKVFLQRGYPVEKDLPAHSDVGTVVRENMEVRICVNTYRLFFMPSTEDLVVKDPSQWERLPKGATEKRKKMWTEKVLPGLGWMKGASKDEIESRQKEWDAFLRGGEPVVVAPVEDADGDVQVEDAEEIADPDVTLEVPEVEEPKESRKRASEEPNEAEVVPPSPKRQKSLPKEVETVVPAVVAPAAAEEGVEVEMSGV